MATRWEAVPIVLIVAALLVVSAVSVTILSRIG
jgi:hypothetical protein